MASERVLKYTMLPRLKIILWSPYLYINCRALRTYVRFWWCLALSVRHMPFTCSCPKMPAWIHALLLSFRPEPRCGVEPFAQITSPLWTKSVEVRYIIIVLFVSPIFSVRRYVSSGGQWIACRSPGQLWCFEYSASIIHRWTTDEPSCQCLLWWTVSRCYAWRVHASV